MLRLMRITLISVAVLLALTLLALGGLALWKELAIYIDPHSASQRKYLIQSFVIVVAGGAWLVVGAGVVGVLYLSGTNLRNQRELQEHSSQQDALAAYFNLMIGLLSDRDRPLRHCAGGEEVSILAKGGTLRVLAKLDGQGKGRVLQFLYETGLIIKDRSVVDLLGADLRGANLRGSNLVGADLRGADLSRANMVGADLRGADLSGANLREANVHWADLISADLSGSYLGRTDLSLADLSGADLSSVKEVSIGQLEQAYSLEGTTMPDGSKHP